MLRLNAALFAFLLVIHSHSLDAQNARYSAADIETLRADIQKILDEDNIPGASVGLVDRNGVIWAGGVGKADVAAGKDVTGDSLFRVGSISKSFTALAVLKLVEQGQLDLDTPIRDIVPELEYTNDWADTDPITVAMVMEHTTGFDDIHFREYAKVDDPDMTLEEGLAYNPGSRISRWRPGEHMSYCNSGPPIAAFVLEKVTGEEFEDFARRNLFEPLGMMHSTYAFPVEGDRLSKGYAEDGETEARYDHIIVRPSGSFNASSMEMGNYLQMMINRGNFRGRQLFKPETISRMERPATTLAARAGHDFGYGLGNYSSVAAGHLWHGHNGGITGFVSTSKYSSDLGLGYFVSINKPSGKLSDISKAVAAFLTRDLIADQPPAYQLSGEEVDAVTGYYQAATPRQALMGFLSRFLSIQRIVEEDGKLWVKGLFGGEDKELIPVSADSFRADDQPVATQFLVTDADGEVFLQGGLAGGNSRQISALSAWFQLGVAALSLLLMVSAVIYALIWAPARIFGKLKSVSIGTVLPPLLAVLGLIAMLLMPVLLVGPDLTGDLGVKSPASVSYFIGTLLFAALTLFALFRTVRSPEPVFGSKVRIHSALVSVACFITLVYLWSYGLIGLRLWAY